VEDIIMEMNTETSSTETFYEGRMLIDGRLVESMSGEWLESINPATEEVIGRVPLGSSADMDAAVEAGRRAQISWMRLPIPERVKYLHRLAQAIEDDAEKIALLEARDSGNLLGAMRRDVLNAADRIRFSAGYAYELKGETIPGSAPNLHMTTRSPYGIVGRITAFNHPFGFAASKIGAILTAGNAAIIKPAEQSPLSAGLLAELCGAVLPPGIVNILTGGRETGRALVRHPQVKRIAFVGSVSAGRAIQRDASDVAVKHVTLELGGKNPLIAFSNVSTDKVAEAAVSGMNFTWQGQSCGSTSRLLLQNDIYDEVVQKILDRVRGIKVGLPHIEGVGMGPINSLAQHQKVLSYVALGKSEGAKLLFGGNIPKGSLYSKGFWIEPAIFGDVTMSMRLAREEVFGPVLSILRFSTEEEAIAMANDVDFGLTAAVLSRDINQALRVAHRLEAGFVWVNGVGAHYRNVPYGGVKNSGLGREEDGVNEIRSYTEEKVINILVEPSDAL
jgi:acyl-CoA reductase-like NAD-dependent aldehyde dehydrogenase